MVALYDPSVVVSGHSIGNIELRGTTYLKTMQTFRKIRNPLMQTTVMCRRTTQPMSSHARALTLIRKENDGQIWDAKDESTSDDRNKFCRNSRIEWHHPVETSCYTSQLPLRSGVGRRLAVEPLVDGRPACSSSERLAPVPMYSMSNRNFGMGMTIPRTGLV